MESLFPENYQLPAALKHKSSHMHHKLSMTSKQQNEINNKMNSMLAFSIEYCAKSLFVKKCFPSTGACMET